MTKNKSIKRTLLCSLLAIILCVSILIGSTYGWYTNKVTSTGNKIVAGILDVAFKWADGTKDVPAKDSTDWTDVSGEAIFGSDQWEPGKTQIAYLQVKNNGNLAFKYSFDLVVQNVSKELYKVLKYDITQLNEPFNESVSWNGEGNDIVVGTQCIFEEKEEYLAPDESRYFALSIHMDDDASTEYQGGEVKFDLILLTAQAAKESDSFSNEYDNDAYYAYYVENSEQLKNALISTKKRSVISLAPGTYSGLSFDSPSSYTAKNVTIIGTNDVVIDGFTVKNGDYAADIEIDGLTFKNVTFTKPLNLSTKVMNNITVEDCDFTGSANIYHSVKTVKLTNLVVKNCTFTFTTTGQTSGLYVLNNENVTITGCTFTNMGYNVTQFGYISGTILIDNNIVNGTANRVFRFTEPQEDAKITISNNTITSNGNSSGQLAGADDPYTITFDNNTWNTKDGVFTDEEVAELGKLYNIN